MTYQQGDRPGRWVPVPPPQCERPSEEVREHLLKQLGENPSQARRCWGCASYQPAGGDGITGTCRLRPPTPRRGITPAGFPETKGWWWCSQYTSPEKETAGEG